MNREDIERLANNLRQINAFGKGGDTNRRKKGGDDNIRVRKPNTMHYDEDAKVYWDYASNLSDEDIDRLIDNNYVFSDNSFLDSKILGEEEPIVVTPQSSEGGRFDHLHRDNNNYNTAFNEPKEWLKKWWYANSNKNTPETKFLVDYVVEKTPITFDMGKYDNYEGAYNVLKEDIKLNPKYKENPLQANFVALHELNHALQNQLKAHKKAWLPTDLKKDLERDFDKKDLDNYLRTYEGVLAGEVYKALGRKRYDSLFGQNGGDYWYSPKEIQSRLMELRYDLNLSPLKNDIDKIKDEDLNVVKKLYYFEELSNDELRRLLKEVTFDNRNDYSNVAAFGGSVNKFDKGGGVKRKKLTAAQEDMINSLENSDMLPTFNQFSDDLSNTTAQQYMLDIAYNPKRWFENSGEAEARRAWARSNNLGFDELAYGLLDKKDQKSKQVTSKMPTDWRTKDFADRVRQAMNNNSMFMTDVIESLPIVGDFAQATKAGNYFYNGEVGKGLYEAGMLGAGFLLPNVLEKIIKKSPLGKKFEKAAIDEIDNISINNLDDFFKKNPSMKEEYDIAFPKYAYNKFIKGTPLENASDEEINYALTRAGLDGYLVAKDNSKFATYRDWWLKNFKEKMDEEKKFLSMFGLTPRQENKFNSPTLGIKNYIESAKEAPNVGGYYVPSTNESFLNINAKYNDIATPESAHIHEGMSHPTDELIKKHRQNYKNVVEEILANHPNGDIIPESINWEEFRALLNEHRAKLLQESGNPNMSMEDFKKLVDEKYNSDKLINEIKKKDIELLNDPEYKLKVGNRDDFDRVRQEVLDDKLDVSLDLMQKIFENSKFKRKALRDIANNEIIPLSQISAYGDDYGQALANLLRNDRDAYVKLSNKIKDLIKTHPALAVPLAVPMVLNSQGEPIDSVEVN